MPPDTIDILDVRFPLLTSPEALQKIVASVDGPAGLAVCFPDMSTMNIAASRPDFRALLQTEMLCLNDGAGLAFAARLQGRRFPANLNGTELTPAVMDTVARDTGVFLLGCTPRVIELAARAVGRRHPNIAVAGRHHGYLEPHDHERIIEMISASGASLVLVAMGNPRQVEFISTVKNDPRLSSVVWLAVGGLLDYYAGEIRRAPAWMVRSRLEWLGILVQQPHKARRYLVGIPAFLTRCLVARLRRPA